MLKRFTLMMLALLGVSSVLFAATTVAAAEGATVAGKVTHTAHVCKNRQTRTIGSTRVPLGGVPLVIRPTGGAAIRTRTSATGRFRVTVRGRGPITVRVTLSTRFIRVKPAEKAAPYRFAFQLAQPGRNKLLVLPGPQEGGAANVFAWMSRAASVARRVLPSTVRLRRVDVIFKDEGDPSPPGIPDISESYYTPKSRTIYVGSSGRQDQFEPFALTHEYGHHVLDMVASPGKGAFGEHHNLDSYPASPALPYSEGFAHAYSTIARQNPRLGFLCRDGGSTATEPARPVSQPRHYAAYNEVAVAGVFWHLARYLGAGDLVRGMRRILAALRSYRRDGQPARHVRDLRDSLIRAGYERTAEAHESLDDIFARQRMAWGISLRGTNLDFAAFGLGLYPEVTGTVSGAYMCQTAVPAFGTAIFVGKQNEVGADYISGRGGLDYTVYDDCLTSEDNNPLDAEFGTNEPALSIAFPYVGLDSHRRDRWTLFVTYLCTDFASESTGDCPHSIRWSGELWRGFHGYVGLGPASSEEDFRLIAFPVPEIVLSLAQPVPVVEFSADGECLVIYSGNSCSI